MPGVAELNGDGQLVAEERRKVPTTMIGSLEVQGEGPLVVREKTHAAAR